MMSVWGFSQWKKVRKWHRVSECLCIFTPMRRSPHVDKLGDTHHVAQKKQCICPAWSVQFRAIPSYQSDRSSFNAHLACHPQMHDTNTPGDGLPSRFKITTVSCQLHCTVCSKSHVPNFISISLSFQRQFSSQSCASGNRCLCERGR